MVSYLKLYLQEIYIALHGNRLPKNLFSLSLLPAWGEQEVEEGCCAAVRGAAHWDYWEQHVWEYCWWSVWQLLLSTAAALLCLSVHELTVSSFLTMLSVIHLFFTAWEKDVWHKSVWKESMWECVKSQLHESHSQCVRLLKANQNDGKSKKVGGKQVLLLLLHACYQWTWHTDMYWWFYWWHECTITQEHSLCPWPLCVKRTISPTLLFL